MNKLENLRNEHQKIIFKSFTYSILGNSLNIEFKYFLAPDLDFSHELSIEFAELEIQEPSLKLIFLLGVMELISYWKLACPPTIQIECGVLSEYEKNWFKDLYRSGLGEFFYVNELDPKLDFDFVIESDAPSLEHIVNSNLIDRDLVMVGGGKDSLVTLRAFQDLGRDFRGFVVNPIPQAVESIQLFSTKEPVRVQRTISSNFLKLSKTKYFNGHVPFSAILAFIGLVVADCAGYRRIVSSNESTANEGNVFYCGVEINHQYSKTFDFESKFRAFVKSLESEVTYYSFLRPLSELQITGFLSKHPSSLSVFLSCNRAQTINAKKEGDHKWCGTCPKCVFTFLGLSPFLTIDELRKIWSPLPLEHLGFFEVVRELCGLGEHKPFECVGSYEESRTGFKYLVEKMSLDPSFAYIIGRVKEILASFGKSKFSSLEIWDEHHFLSKDEELYLKNNLNQISFRE